MSEGYVDFQPGRMLGRVAAHWRLVAVCVAVGLALAAVRLLMGGVTYTAQSQILVGQPLTFASLTSTSGNAGVDQARLVDLVKRLIESETTAAKIEKKLQITEDDYDLSVVSASTTNVMGLTATSSDPETAKNVANGFASFYLDEIKNDNSSKVRRAAAGITAEIEAVEREIAELDATLRSGAVPAAGMQLANSQRTALIGQKLQLQNRQTQVKLAGRVDPSGGARMVQVAENGETSTFAVVAPLVLGALFGLLISLALVAVQEARGRRRSEDTDEELYGEPANSPAFADFPDPARV